MVILIKANLLCNFECRYCYQHPIRPEEQVINYEAVEATIKSLHAKELERKKKNCKKGEKVKGPTIGLHGGEPTLLPKSEIERFLKLSCELNGYSSIQTNGYLIDDDMIELFRKYNTGVGISIDGPWPLNELRGVGDSQQRKKQTTKILKIIDKLRKTKLPEKYWGKDKDGKPKESYIRVSVIAVLHKKNALGDRRETIKQWVKGLHEKNIRGRLNPCCCGDPEIDLTPEEAAEAYSDLFDFMIENGIYGFSPFRDIINTLKGNSNVVCVFRECDPYCTPSAISVLHDGNTGVCLRLHMDTKSYLRNEPMRRTRSDVLKQSDCKDCKWWNHCYGGCCGLAIDWDWRNKDRYCLMYKTLFEKATNALKFFGIKGKSRNIRKTQENQRFEHIDGDVRHIDSDLGSQEHWDGSEHLDGNLRHLDSDVT
ncbi:MAG: radical SAM protein [Candidatus Thorarchaeota archaeon]